MARTSSSATTKTLTTPTKKRSAPPPPRNKIETSPNNRSKCHHCGIKISKGEERFGIVEGNEYGRTQRYYHPNCCPEELKSRLPSPEQMERIQQVEQHRELVNELRHLRSLFAEELDVEHFKVLHDKSIDDLVLKLPTTKTELLQVWGIKEKKVQNFGDAILAVIRQYRQRHPDATPSVDLSSSNTTKQKKARRKKDKKDDDDDDDDLIAVGETLTCEEIVKRKFEHAKKNGYVITVD